MIHPDVDLDAASDDEIIAAYLAIGFDRAEAIVYLHVIRNRDSRFACD
jgi:hypothetical protein